MPTKLCWYQQNEDMNYVNKRTWGVVKMLNVE